MSLFLLDSPVKVAISRHLSTNLLSRQCASNHNIDNAFSIVHLLVTVRFLNQGRSVVLPFVISDDILDFEIILGSEWDLWCIKHKGESNAVFSCSCVSNMLI